VHFRARRGSREAFSPPDPLLYSYKTEMTKTIERWLLFTFEHGEFTPLSKPFKTKKLAEKARLKYPEREARKIGIGVVRVSIQ
jgi:hypothetical protein